MTTTRQALSVEAARLFERIVVEGRRIARPLDRSAVAMTSRDAASYIGTDDSIRLWEVFGELLSTPLLLDVLDRDGTRIGALASPLVASVRSLDDDAAFVITLGNGASVLAFVQGTKWLDADALAFEVFAVDLEPPPVIVRFPEPLP